MSGCASTSRSLLNLAGQTVTAVLPLGDLTRALFASQATGAAFGATAATVTVQDLTFTSLLVIAATPALIGIPGGWVISAFVLGGIAATLLDPRRAGRLPADPAAGRACSPH